MKRKPWHLDRRQLLRGVGVSCGLPYLQAMDRALAAAKAPGAAAQGEAERAKRLAFVYFPNGCSLPSESDETYAERRWFPRGEGANYEFTEVLAALEPYREQLSILGGLSHPKSRELLGHLAGDTWLTAGDVRGELYQNSISVDQVAARALRRHTRYPSFVFSTDGGVGYKSRVSTLSFNGNGRPVPSEHRPREIFERYFTPQGGATTAERRRSLQAGKKVVDLVLEDSKRLRRRLGAHDQDKLEEYLTSLNSVEEQIRRNEAWLHIPLKPFDASRLELDPDPRSDPQAALRSMFDLVVLGFQLDMTRVMTFMTGREDGMGFADHFPRLALGINRGHHTISHDLHEGHWEDWGRYDQWFAEQFAYYLERLATTSDEHGPLLDSTLVLFGSCCSTTHNARNYPLALAGGKHLGLAHGQYRKYDNDTPFSNLLLSMLHAVGVEAESFADSTGTIPELLA